MSCFQGMAPKTIVTRWFVGHFVESVSLFALFKLTLLVYKETVFLKFFKKLVILASSREPRAYKEKHETVFFLVNLNPFILFSFSL